MKAVVYRGVGDIAFKCNLIPATALAQAEGCRAWVKLIAPILGTDCECEFAIQSQNQKRTVRYMEQNVRPNPVLALDPGCVMVMHKPYVLDQEFVA